MKTQHTINATQRVSDYVSKLKHGASFKYVKGLSRDEKLLANILFNYQKNTEYQAMKVTNAQMQAFGYKPTDANGMYFFVDVDTKNKITIIPLAIF